MALKNLVVMGCSLNLSSSAGTVGSGTCSVTSNPSQAVKADNKYAYFGSMTVAVSNATITAVVAGTTGQGVSGSGTITINGSAEKTFSPAGAGAQPALLEGDSGEGSVTFTFTTTTTPPTTTPVPLICKVTISGAGQSKVTAS